MISEKTNREPGKSVHLEFVSANPTGPLHVGHGRGAALGDVLGRVLEASGFRVHREYYINDAGNQIETLAKSAYARYSAGREGGNRLTSRRTPIKESTFERL